MRKRLPTAILAGALGLPAAPASAEIQPYFGISISKTAGEDIAVELAIGIGIFFAIGAASRRSQGFTMVPPPLPPRPDPAEVRMTTVAQPAHPSLGWT